MISEEMKAQIEEWRREGICFPYPEWTEERRLAFREKIRKQNEIYAANMRELRRRMEEQKKMPLAEYESW